jgi:hypothetical protein
MDSAWDPVTGQSIDDSEFENLIAAAGGAQPGQHMQPTPGTLCIRLSSPVGLVDQFFTLDKVDAVGRMMAFLDKATDPGSHVTIEQGSYIAIACRLSSNAQVCQTFWMDRSIPKHDILGAFEQHKHTLCVNYQNQAMSIWATHVVTMFESSMRMKSAAEDLAQRTSQNLAALALQRSTHV